MNIEKLFKKAEKFFVLDKSIQEEKVVKKAKLRCSLEKKIMVLKNKIKKVDNSNEKKVFKKQLSVLKEFLKKLNKG